MRWVHLDLEGNEEADHLANNAAHEDRIEIALQYGLSQCTSIIQKPDKEMWQNT